MFFKIFQISLIANEAKYGQIKRVTFTVDQRNHYCKIIIEKYVQYIMTKTLKDLLAGVDAGFQKSQSKFLNKFSVQPHLEYFTYQLTSVGTQKNVPKNEVPILKNLLLLLLLFLIKSWGVEGLRSFKFQFRKFYF